MFKWGPKSQAVREGADEQLQRVLDRALSYGVVDMSIIESIRSREKQDEYFAAKKSKVRWPYGKHNVTQPGQKSKAVDVAPFINGGISWRKDHCCVMAGLILAAAFELGIKVRWGGNWDMDAEPITDQDFQDLVHFELVD